MNKLYFLLTLLLPGSFFYAQDLGELDVKVYDYGTKHFRGGGQRVYVAGFNVHYQVYFSASDSQAAKRKTAGFRAGSRVKAAVGLGGLTETALLDVTDGLYQNFRGQLEAAGYSFVDADVAAGISAYEGWERVAGGSVSRAQTEGYVTVNPRGVDFFVPRIKNSGKRGAKLFDNTAYISDQLDDAVVVKVDIFLPFAEDGESGWSRSLGRMTDESKVVIRTRYRLGAPSVVEKKGLAALQDIGTLPVTNGIVFTRGKIKVGAGAEAQYRVDLKRDLEIQGVMDDEKIKRYAVGSFDFTASSFGSLSYYSAESEELDTFIQVEFDRDRYLQGALLAGKAYLDEAVSGFLGKAK